MVERITISFDMDKEVLLNMFKEETMAKALEEFLKTYFSSYIQIHVENIKHNMKAVNREIKEEESQQIAFEHLKSCIENENMEKLKIEVVKAFFKESFTDVTKPDIAIEKAFKKAEVVAIAEEIQKKIRCRFIS